MNVLALLRTKTNRLLLLYFISYTLVILLPVISIGYFSYRLAFYTAEEEISHSHNHSLDHTAVTFDDTLRKINSLAVSIGLDGRLRSYSANANNRYLINEFQDILKQTSATDSSIHSVQLFFESGQLMISSDVLTHVYKGADSDQWVEQIRNSDQDSMWIPPVKVRNYDGHEESVLTFIRKVPFSTHEKLGYVAIHIYEKRLQDQLKQMQNIANMNTYIVAEDGTLISSFHQAPVDSDGIQAYMNRILSSASNGYFTDRSHRPTSLIAYSDKLWNGWRLISQTPLTNIYDKLSYIGRITFIFCLILSLIGIGISFWLSRKMYDPIKQLIERTRAYTDELILQYPIHDTNELRLVSHALETAIVQKKLLDQQFRRQVPVMQERFATDLLQGRLTRHANIQEAIDLYNLDLSLKGYAILIIELDHADELARKFTSKELNLYQYAIENVASELIQTLTHYRFLMTDISEYRQAVILNVFDMMEADELRELSQHIQSVIGVILKLSVSIGIGSVYPDITAAHKSYQEALKVLRNKLLHGVRSVLVYEPSVQDKPVGYTSLLRTEKQLTNNLKMGHTEEALAILTGLKQEMTLKQLDSESVYFAYSRLLEASCETLIEHNGDPQQLFGIGASLHYEFAKRETLDHIHQWMSEIISNISSYIQEQTGKNNKSVEKVISFIHANYQRDLSVDMIAEGVGFNPSYLSRLFKQHTGHTILEYLTMKRIDESKQLLISTSMNLNDISLAIGYNNVNSYIRFFKKLEGITPGEYRKKNQAM